MVNYLESEKFLDDPRHKSKIQRLVLRFIHNNDIFYRHSFDGVSLGV